jgi:hypothetical protein
LARRSRFSPARTVYRIPTKLSLVCRRASMIV